MRLIKNGQRVIIRRRGMSFIEVISCVIVVALLCSIIIGSASVLRNYMKDTVDYTTMKLYAVDKIESIQADLERGVEIDVQNYNDNGEESGVHADVYIRDIGEVFDKPLYHVEIRMTHTTSLLVASTEAILRQGGMSYEP